MDLDLELDVAALAQRLVDIESVSGQEQEITDAVMAALRPYPHLRTERDGNVVIARTELGRLERVVLAGHTDTVPVAGNLPSRLADGVLSGCGSCDMKSGLAVALRLAASLPAPTRDVTYVFYDCEEIQAKWNGLGRLARTRPEVLAGDLAVLLEPSGAVIEGGCQGTMRAEITARGQRAHAARSWRGHNAIHEAGRVLDVLRGYVPRQPEVEGLRYHEGLNAVRITGGVAGNVIPDECVIAVNFRFAPDLGVAAAEEHLRSVFAGFELTIADAAPGALPGLGRPATASLAAAVGGQPRAKLGWTDTATFASLGMPAVNYGPGDPELAHTPGEHVAVSEIFSVETALRGWLTS